MLIVIGLFGLLISLFLLFVFELKWFLVEVSDSVCDDGFVFCGLFVVL